MAESILNDQLAQDKKYWLLFLQDAHNKRVSVTLQDINNGNLPPPDSLTSVFLPEKQSHLYPWLLTEAYKLGGEDEASAQKKAGESARHEYQHSNAKVSGQVVYFGVRFFEVVDDSGKSYGIGTQPFAMILGAATVEENRQIVGAPDDLSDSDKHTLKKL